jgi:WhiB family transcriptional regulator, redox-sensing transcriptional regulator
MTGSRSRSGWRTAAACAGLGPDLFYDPSPVFVARAKALCERCPVRASCLAAGLANDEEGVWGGLVEDERAVGTVRRFGPAPSVSDGELVGLFSSADRSTLALALLRRRGGLSRRTIYKYLARAHEIGLVELRNGRLYPTGR